jgi:pyruvate/2-oxoglutarate dehydrogenase complex dihydrolipoamide dehydrogenase (E3) component
MKDCFVKVIVKSDGRILGATIIRPSATALIQEIINAMYTREERSGYQRCYSHTSDFERSGPKSLSSPST